MGETVANDHSPVRQIGEPRAPEALRFSVESFAMQDFVHGVNACRRAGKGGEERLRRLAPALETGSVAGGERSRLVEKEKVGVSRTPHFAPPPFEFAAADNPALRGPAPGGQCPIVAMKPSAAVAQHCAPRRDGVKAPERIDSVLQRPEAPTHGAGAG
jgi:hypothetical protein